MTQSKCKHDLGLVEIRRGPNGLMDILAECKICKEHILFGGCHPTAHRMSFEATEGIEVTELELDYDND